MIQVRGLSVTAVKGTRLLPVESVTLERDGAVGNRQFFVIDDRDRMVNAKNLGELQTVVAAARDGALSLTFPDGSTVSSAVRLGEPVAARFFSRVVEGRLLDGPWAAALSEHLGQPVRVVAAAGSVDRGVEGAVSLISRASLQRLASVAAVSDVDARRFRMLIEVDGVAAHEEDAWVGRRGRVGDATVRWGGHVGRCLITSRHPDTGSIDLPTLDLLGEYRGSAPSTEPLPFGIFGMVITPGSVRVDDPVSLLD